MAITRAAPRDARRPGRRERAYASRHDSTIFLVAAFTGLRRGEVLSLRWRGIDFEASSVHVCESVSAGRAGRRRADAAGR